MGALVGQVVGRRMVFSVVIRHIHTTFVPIKAELTLRRTTVEPMEPHTMVSWMKPETVGGGVVSLDRGFRLGLAHFGEGIA